MNVKPIKEIVEFLAPIAAETGVEIVDAKWEARTRTLHLFIDAEDGVDLDLCEKFHRAADGPLDELDPTFGASYTLSCSSAGLDRPFKTDRDYERRLGERVEVHLFAPLFGAKYHEGTLLSFDDASVTISSENGELAFPREKIAKCCLLIEV